MVLIEKPLLRAIAGESVTKRPFWLMRQAGRYLPEYRKLRAEAGSFLDLCNNAELAAEISLQPIRRFDMDAAIIFSDILVIPAALGQKLAFEVGEGPKLDPIRHPAELTRLSKTLDLTFLDPAYRALKLVAKELPAKTALIGFAGAPWTLATYMVEGGSSREFVHVKAWAKNDPESFGRLIDLLTEAVIQHLSAQIDAGAEVVQVFDSWASATDDASFAAFVVAPMVKIVRALKARYPAVPIVGFPRAIGARYETFVRETNVDMVSLDQGIALDYARDRLQGLTAVQGCLNPELLVQGGAAMRQAVDAIVGHLGRGRFVFNLGHGVLQQTPPDHVAELADYLRSLPV